MESVTAIVPRFLEALAQMLTDDDTEVTWVEDGTAMHVRNIEKFSQHILPRYFRHKQWASFQRQLNNYGFRKKRLGARLSVGGCVYWHPHFVQHKPELLHLVTAKRRSHRASPQLAVIPRQTTLLVHALPLGSNSVATTDCPLPKEADVDLIHDTEPFHPGMLHDMTIGGNPLAWLDDLVFHQPLAMASQVAL